jgi:bacillopeptidase F (M6 metalloprotease family)
MVKRTFVFFILAALTITTASCSTQKKEPTQHENHKVSDSQNKKEEAEAVSIIANDDRIIEMLKKNGEIPEDATPEEIQKALKKYLQKKAPGPGTLQDEKAKQKYINELKEKIQKEKNGTK